MTLLRRLSYSLQIEFRKGINLEFELGTIV
jgi:hypothetical protein